MTRAVTSTAFQDTEAGLIPNDWEVRRVGDFLQFYGGKAHEPFVSAGAKYIVVNSKFISTDGAVEKRCRLNLLPARVGDVLMVMSDLPNGRALAKCFLATADDLYAVNQRVCIFRTRHHDPRYLKYALNRNRYFMSFDDGVQQTHLLNDTIKKCPVVLPPPAEQRAIADALSDADVLVSALERMIAKKQAIKQGMMQELLTGKTRLPGFSDPWHQSTLGELGRCIRGVGYNPDEDLSTGDRTCTIRLLRGNNVQAARVDLGDLQFVHERRVSDVQLLTPSDIVICMSSGSRALVGKSALFDITDTGHRYTFGAFMGAFRPNPRRVSPGFVAGVLHTYSFRTWLEIILSGSSINNLRPRDIEGFVCHFPKEDEQRAIAAVLADADAEIELLQGRLTKARDIKQGMAQELLTGRTRLPVEEGAT